MANRGKKERIPYCTGLTIRPTYSVFYPIRADGLRPGRKSDMPKINQPLGVISNRAEKRIRIAVQWLVICSEYKRVYSKKEKKSFSFLINFITLTLSEKQKHSDIEIKEKMLNPFLDWLQRSHGAKSYLWKAEAQKETGNIHFHITTNVFVHWKSIRKKWNSLQFKLGYEKAFTDGNTNGANSTDVHAVKNMKRIGAYISKYFTKSEKDRRLIDGKLWGCSQNLSKVKINLTEFDADFNETKTEYMFRNEMQKIETDFCEVFIHRPLDKLKLPTAIKKQFQEIKTNILKEEKQQKNYTIESFF